MSKQSSIQQFWGKIALKLSVEQINEFFPLFEQAKEIHKIEHFNAWVASSLNKNKPITFQQYYNETFGE